MQRAMRGFRQDAQGDWVAELECGHTQHLRHRPPFTLRPWVTTAQGRQERIGQTLECPPCGRSEVPAGYAAYRRTPAFRSGRIPEGLLRQHETKPGVWALLEVSSGSLDFIEQLGDGEHRTRVDAGGRAVIRPAVSHRVEPNGDVEFCIEFWHSERT
jgi:tellurite methyltransferase